MHTALKTLSVKKFACYRGRGITIITRYREKGEEIAVASALPLQTVDIEKFKLVFVGICRSVCFTTNATGRTRLERTIEKL